MADAKAKTNINQPSTLLQDVLEHITTVVHVLTLLLTLFVIYLCFQSSSFNLLTWHVFLYTIGWILLIAEGILYITKENIFAKRVSSRVRNHTHWIVIMLGVALSIGGFVTIYQTKNGVHFTSVHGITGLVSGILGLLACANGVLTLFSTSLRKWISPNLNKIFHAFVGFAAVVIGAYCMITGYYLGWFKNKTTETGVNTCIVVTVLITFWALLRPLINMFVRARTVCS